MPKLATLKIQQTKISQFEPPLKSSIFPGLYFEKICSFSKPKSTKVKTLTVKRAQKQQENSKNVSQKGLQSLTDVLQHPVFFYPHSFTAGRPY